MMLNSSDFEIVQLGPRRFPSPIAKAGVPSQSEKLFVSDQHRVAYEVEWQSGQQPAHPLSFEKAGPRKDLYFDPATTKAAIVTCGGLCPGLNNVIRSLVLELHHHYGVRNILGIRYGYEGMNPEQGVAPRPLGPDDVRTIHHAGGSVLGLGRGKQDLGVMLDFLKQHQVDILFTIGGDGTLRGACALGQAARERGQKLSVVGIPKTIDNDIPFVDKTFGFETAVETARQAIDAAHCEALGARNGVGLVKLMGRDAGYIAAHATLASEDVNFCLIPEVPFELDGDSGLISLLRKRLERRAHALIVVAEGCGIHLVKESSAHDASGNIRYANRDLDIGSHLRDTIVERLKSEGFPITLKYIDPSYMIRSVAANANDSIFCNILARHAVHAAMAGKSELLIGRCHGIFTHIPLLAVATQKKTMSPYDSLWFAVTQTTGQPVFGTTLPDIR
jgi:6-phosphofructokinase 1